MKHHHQSCMNRDMGFVKKVGCIGALVLSMFGNSGCATVASTVVSPFVATKNIIEEIPEIRKDILTKAEKEPLSLDPAVSVLFYPIILPLITSLEVVKHTVGGSINGMSADAYFSRHGRYPDGYTIWGDNWKLYPFQSYEYSRSRDVEVPKEWNSLSLHSVHQAHQNTASILGGASAHKRFTGLNGAISLSNEGFGLFGDIKDINNGTIVETPTSTEDSFDSDSRNGAISIPWSDGSGGISGFFSKTVRQLETSPNVSINNKKEEYFDWFSKFEFLITPSVVAELQGGRDSTVQKDVTSSKNSKSMYNVTHTGFGLTFIGSDYTVIKKTSINTSVYNTTVLSSNFGTRTSFYEQRNWQYDADVSTQKFQIGATRVENSYYDYFSLRGSFWSKDMGLSLFQGYTGFGGGVTYIFNSKDVPIVRADWQEYVAMRSIGFRNSMADALHSERNHSLLKNVSGTVFYAGIEGAIGDPDTRYVTKLLIPFTEHFRLGLNSSGNISGNGIYWSSGVNTAKGEWSKKNGAINSLEAIIDTGENSSLTIGASLGDYKRFSSVYSSSGKFEDTLKTDKAFSIQYEFGW